MLVTVILGAQWGDEVKRKMADLLEAANGKLLDTDLGTYLFCTASMVPVLGHVAQAPACPKLTP
jgi:adenylosuccinate synthase